MASPVECAGLSTTFDSGREGTPDLRLLHFNDVYHVETGSAEPVGGAARFQSLVEYYRSDPRFEDQPCLLTFFSGDAFNPSLESTITKGRHMVPFLNMAGTDVACVGMSCLGNLKRITTWTLESPSSDISGANASSPGSWPTC
ncbi:hypothetical protein VTO42DRAFT_4255 [Malbranchea cinnamomea]